MRRVLAITAVLAVQLACGGAEQAPPPAPEEPAEPAPPAALPPLEVPEGAKLFDRPNAPFQTVHPVGTSAVVLTMPGWDEVTFALPGVSAGTGLTFRFPKDASKDDLAAFKTQHIAGPIGIFGEHADWRRTGATGGNPAMPWLVEAISFEGDEGVLGRVLIGKGPHGYFRVVELLASSDLDAMRPVIQSVYTNLRLKD